MEPNKAAYRTVKLIGLLLILEVIGLVAIGGFEFFQVHWRGLELEGSRHNDVEIAVYALFIPSGILTLMSAFSFLFMRRKGWLLAAIAQGLSLAVSLWLYSWFQPPLRLPHHGLLRADDPLPQLLRREGGLPSQAGFGGFG